MGGSNSKRVRVVGRESVASVVICPFFDCRTQGKGYLKLSKQIDRFANH